MIEMNINYPSQPCNTGSACHDQLLKLQVRSEDFPIQSTLRASIYITSFMHQMPYRIK